MGYAELLKLKYPEISHSNGKAADIIFKGAERASDLTKQLLGFARGGKYNPITLNINEIILEAVKVSEKIFEKKIKVKYDFEKSIKMINADKNQLNQVITNLIINARDAMPKGGAIYFSTENCLIDKVFDKIFFKMEPGEYVKVSVPDTGTGMSDDVKKHIFEPFFTTKGEGLGTGLGLATVYGIVKNHKGYINVYSESGEGTNFTIYFPITKKEIEDGKKEPVPLKGEGTILIVDDEESVRKMTDDMLVSLGYQVYSAKNGQEAIQIFEKSKNEIDLVLLDMIMPDMDGKKTFNKLKKIKPDVKVLLSSGFSKEGKAEEIIKDGVKGFIQKPYKMIELSNAIFNLIKK